MAVKRDHTGQAVGPSAGRFAALFEGFRNELDEHHDRRERLVKASRDITALSKKIIFSLQRASGINQEVHPKIQSEINTRLSEIQKLLVSILPDLQFLNRHRYVRQLGCMEELVEALSMAHYLRTQTLITPSQAIDVVTSPIPGSKNPGKSTADAPPTTQATAQKDNNNTTSTGAPLFSELDKSILITEKDYIFGVADLFGEMMRFATARNRAPGVLVPEESPHGRSVLNDIQELGFAFETLPKTNDKFFNRKLEAMRPSVKKVEVLGYRLTIQRGEHAEGWVPDGEDDVGME